MDHERTKLGRVPILSMVLLALLFWWWLRRRPQETFIPAFKSEPALPTRSSKASSASVTEAAPHETPTSVVAPTFEIPQPTTTSDPTQSWSPVIAPTPSPEAATSETVAAPSPDDLTRIEGIGPKITSVLQAAGITTFAQLAATEVSQLEQILQQAGLRLANPNTWPEQAKLAAAGDWDGLKALQSQLKGGRRIQ